MMNVNIYDTEIFPYLEGEALKGSTLTLTIRDIRIEEMKSHAGKKEKKYVLYFVENAKGFVLNKTNAKRIAQLHGKLTGLWEGKQITIYTEAVQAFGETHNALRVSPSNPEPEPEDWINRNPTKGSFFQHARDDLGLSVEVAAEMLKTEGFTNGYDPVAAPDMWATLLRAPMPQDVAIGATSGMDDIEAEEDAQMMIDSGQIDSEAFR